MIFPGMDPYLEDPRLWKGFHTSLMVYLRDYLQPQLKPRFVAAVEERVYLQGADREVSPDVWVRRTRHAKARGAVALLEPDAPVIIQVSTQEIHERYVTILDPQSGQRVVTVIEVVSPTNKELGEGRQLYLQKEKEVRASDANLVEIDLLRTGPHAVAVPESHARRKAEYDYLISVNRAQVRRDTFEVYPCSLRKPLPRVRIPLVPTVPDVVLDLQAVVTQTYEKGAYHDRIDYHKPCHPSLSSADQAWANQLIKSARRKMNGMRKAPKKSTKKNP
jgi:hypothetical protein